MDRASFRRIKLLSSTRDFADIRCLQNFNLEDWASLKTLTGCFENLNHDQDQLNRQRDDQWPIYRLPHNDLIPVMILSHSPEN